VKGIKKKAKKKSKSSRLQPFHCGLYIILKDEIGRTKLMRKKKKKLNQPG
jgi:hypothetical protein